MKQINRISQDRSRRRLSLRRGGAWLMFLAAVTLMPSCRDYYDEMPIQQQFAEEDMAYLDLNIATGDNTSPAITRAEARAENGENYIHTIKVWAFGNVGTRRVLFGYTAADFNHDPTGKETLETFYKTLQLAIPNIYIETGSADFYFLANSESFTDATFSDQTTEETLKALTLGSTYYASYAGQTIPVGSTEQPCAGLPIARIVKGVPLNTIKTDLQPTRKPLRVVMQRAVPRIRFYVARDEAADENFKISSIKIGNGTDNLLLSNECVFPNEVTWDNDLADASLPPKTVADALAAWKAKTQDAYQIVGTTKAYTKDQISAAIPAAASQTIAAVENIEETYNALADNEARIAWIIGKTNGKNNATLINVTYLRESDITSLPLGFEYVGGSGAKAQTLTLAEKDLFRNHDIIVFAYLKGGKLEIKLSVIDWKLSTPSGNTLTEEGE